jgi:hypothetical protein
MTITPEAIFMLICLATSIVAFFQPATELYLKLFPAYLLITIAVEMITVHLSYKGQNTLVIYNLFSAFEFMFNFFILRYIITRKQIKQTINVIMIIYPVLALLNFAFVQGKASFHSMSYTLGCILVIALCIIYFIDVFQKPQEASLLKLPAFWVCTAIMFSYCCTFPFFAMLNFFQTVPPIIFNNIRRILSLINILSYSLLTIAFLCRIRIRRSIS